MKYTKGSLGRIFLLKFDDDDILVDELSIFAKKERLKAVKSIDPATGLNLLKIL